MCYNRLTIIYSCLEVFMERKDRKDPEVLLERYKDKVKIGVIGSRDRNEPADKEELRRILSTYLHLNPVFVSGGCPKGGDRFAEELSEEFGLDEMIVHYPDKSKLDPYLMERGLAKAAHAKINFARNELIARDSDILIALVREDRKGGTENTIDHFLKTFGKARWNCIAIYPVTGTLLDGL